MRWEADKHGHATPAPEDDAAPAPRADGKKWTAKMVPSAPGSDPYTTIKAQRPAPPAQ